MALEELRIHHVNVTVARDIEDAAKRFYSTVLGLEEIPRPEGQRPPGAWYRLGGQQLHLSIEDGVQQRSRRHVCYQVRDVAGAEQHFRDAGVEILDDERPIPGVRRFFVRDPGGNRIEITESASEN